LAAYARLVEPGVSYAEPSIGRIVSSPNFRKKGMGKELMEVSINELQRHFGPLPIRISGQLYLQKFYEGFGFAKVGEQYLEDNIPHIKGSTHQLQTKRHSITMIIKRKRYRRNTS